MTVSTTAMSAATAASAAVGARVCARSSTTRSPAHLGTRATVSATHVWTRAMPAAHMRARATAAVHIRPTMIPAMPAVAAAPAESAAEGITAPVEAGTVPAVRIEAVVAAAENELSLLHVRWHRDARLHGKRLRRCKSTERRER